MLVFTLQEDLSIVTECKCTKFTCPTLSDVGIMKHDEPLKKRSVLDELDELDEIAAKHRKRRAINLHELGNLAGMVKQKRDRMRK